jgi:hypothetical protein
MAGTAHAQSISFDSGQPTSPAAGKISATGTFDVGTGNTLNSIILFAHLPNGGEGGQQKCNTNAPNWDGTITGLMSNKTYDVFARMTYVDSSGTVHTLDTPTKTVKVK